MLRRLLILLSPMGRNPAQAKSVAKPLNPFALYAQPEDSLRFSFRIFKSNL